MVSEHLGLLEEIENSLREGQYQADFQCKGRLLKTVVLDGAGNMKAVCEWEIVLFIAVFTKHCDFYRETKK